MYLALCLLLAVGALAQVPTTCPGPKQFEGRFQRYDRERRFHVQGAMAYDETSKRIKEFEDESTSGNRTVYVKLKLYMENKEYILDLKTRKCNVTVPRHPFHPYGVPPGSNFQADAVVGAAGVPGESVTVANFAYKMENATFFVSVSEPHCFPISHAYFSQEGLEVTNFFDGQEGISDPDAFQIPKECTSL
ncbi:mammalian ependymin-related protein 1 isoform X1 [Aplysia californica]|uniref:Mammalian ependymin-related protein 1 isoform X1 n=1 Tax=Aplysia californica TaxID=6500 RepID=A0ABM0K290_APLCA|nr:mammalian ependymin-related protein 1 isoform X1 [Aplysia californica]